MLNGIKQLMERIEGRMASDAQLIKDAGKLVKKVGVQLSQLPDHSQTNETGPDVAAEEGQSAEEVNYKAVNLLKLGGINDSERAKRVALQLFTRDELRKHVTDPRRAAKARTKADEERTELFKRAVRGILGSKFLLARYQYLLSLVNQIGLNIREDGEADKENTPICSVSEGERNVDQGDLAEDSSTVAKEKPRKNSRANFEKIVENHLTSTRSGRLVTRK